jgi:hypothetical protein
MTVEAALAKMMIGLGRYPDLGALRSWLERDVVGEREPHSGVAARGLP